MIRLARFLTFVIFLLFCSPGVHAQGFLKKLSGNPDTNYIASYLDHLTSRLYASVKSAEVSFRDHNVGKDLIYHPNEPLILGFGFNYGILGLNIGLNFPIVNNDDDIYGKTDYLDLQTHIYMPVLILDIYLQYYKGYHLTRPGEWMNDWPVYDTFPKRPDISSVSLGLNGQYVFNHKHFSYRASFLQNEWQKKSAGSFLIGGNIFFEDTKGDSSFIPRGHADSNFFGGLHFSQS